MGEAFGQLIQAIKGLFTWWVIVAPWEEGLRVRAVPFKAVTVTKLGPRMHVRIPLLDRVYVQSIRTRMSPLAVQTITTVDGATVTVAGNLRYQIVDLVKLYDSLDHAEDTIEGLAMAAVAGAIAGLKRENCTLEQIQTIAESHLDLTPFGIGEDVEITLTTFAFVRTYRFITDQQHKGYGDFLDTASPVNTGMEL